MLDYKKLSPVLIFIFGGSGDLTYRKLNPALFNLFMDNAMPDNFSIVGIARDTYADGEYEKHLKEGIDNFSRRKDSNGAWETFWSHVSYLQMEVNDDTDFSNITKIAKDKETEFGVHPNVIFYMAVAPQLVPAIVKNLGKLDYLPRYKMHTHCN